MGLGFGYLSIAGQKSKGLPGMIIQAGMLGSQIKLVFCKILRMWMSALAGKGYSKLIWFHP